MNINPPDEEPMEYPTAPGAPERPENESIDLGDVFHQVMVERQQEKRMEVHRKISSLVTQRDFALAKAQEADKQAKKFREQVAKIDAKLDRIKQGNTQELDNIKLED